ncbi:hypothetical protein MTO96_020283 [Rhipicephalus appendiculatus]
MCVRRAQTHVWPPGIPHGRYRELLGRRARAFLLRLRTDCSRTAERLFRLTNNGSPSCAQCPAEETLEHIQLQCPGYNDQRRQLFGVYGRLGLLNPLRRAGPDIPSASAAPGLIIAFYADDRLRRSRNKKRQLRRMARETPAWRRRNPTWTSGRQAPETGAMGGGQRLSSAALETLRVDH